MSAAQVPMDFSPPRAGVTGGCKLSDMGAGGSLQSCVRAIRTLLTAKQALQTVLFGQMNTCFVLWVIIQQCFL